MTGSADLPYPPLELANRVGSLEAAAEPYVYYDELGRDARSSIVRMLPAGWQFEGKRVLDFGCGAGRTLRHFASEAAHGEFWGCDIDEPSVAWLKENLTPPFHIFSNGPEPPLDQPRSSFDLVWGISVFTHLTDSWSRWLAELHRILRPEGLLYLTFMGRGMYELIAGEQLSESQVGMNITKCGQSWDLWGPMVLHSPWWIEEHWGRAFEILSLVPDGFATSGPIGQGAVLMRRRDVAVTPLLFEQIRPDDGREAAALLQNVEQLKRETVELRTLLAHEAGQREAMSQRVSHAEARLGELTALLSTIEHSRSWNLTRPLRDLARRARSVGGRAT